MSTTICVECNSEVPDASDFCPECGFPAEAGKASCPECLNPVSLSLEACPECGFPLEGLREAHEAAELAPPPDEALAEGAADNREQATATAPEPTSAPAAVRVREETVVVKRIEGEDLSDQVLQAQVESLNELTSVLGRMIERGGGDPIGELAARITDVLESAEGSKNEILSDLITSINGFVESSEKIKNDMMTELKEQNLTAISSIQEVATTFSTDLKTAAEGIKEAQKGAVAEINSLAQQIKAAAAKEPEPAKSDVSEYVLYICGVVLLFTALNIIVTAYVVKLLKGAG